VIEVSADDHHFAACRVAPFDDAEDVVDRERRPGEVRCQRRQQDLPFREGLAQRRRRAARYRRHRRTSRAQDRHQSIGGIAHGRVAGPGGLKIGQAVMNDDDAARAMRDRIRDLPLDRRERARRVPARRFVGATEARGRPLQREHDRATRVEARVVVVFQLRGRDAVVHEDERRGHARNAGLGQGVEVLARGEVGDRRAILGRYRQARAGAKSRAVDRDRLEAGAVRAGRRDAVLLQRVADERCRGAIAIAADATPLERIARQRLDVAPEIVGGDPLDLASGGIGHPRRCRSRRQRDAPQQQDHHRSAHPFKFDTEAVDDCRLQIGD
jgi:hypothetical protein